MTFNKALIALALGFALAACSNQKQAEEAATDAAAAATEAQQQADTAVASGDQAAGDAAQQAADAAAQAADAAATSADAAATAPTAAAADTAADTVIPSFASPAWKAENPSKIFGGSPRPRSRSRMSSRRPADSAAIRIRPPAAAICAANCAAGCSARASMRTMAGTALGKFWKRPAVSGGHSKVCN